MSSQNTWAIHARARPSRASVSRSTSINISIHYQNPETPVGWLRSSPTLQSKQTESAVAEPITETAQSLPKQNTRSHARRVHFEEDPHPRRHYNRPPLPSPPPPPRIRRYKVQHRSEPGPPPDNHQAPEDQPAETPIKQIRKQTRISEVKEIIEPRKNQVHKGGRSPESKPLWGLDRGENSMVTYNSTALTLVKTSTADPYIVAAHSRFFLIFTTGDRIEIWSAPTLSDFRDNHRATIIWRPPPGTEHSDGLWAPELHCIQNRWWVYYAAAHPRHGNKSHRMWVLAGPPASQDPTTGHWDFVGSIRGMPSDQWAIDGTAFELGGQLYFAYSGWPFGVRDNDLIQRLFIIRLSSPTVASSNPVEICRPEQPWEFSHDGNGAHGINEGPQFLESPNGAWKGIVFSCAGSWTKDYKMALLHYRGGDPLNPASWYKDTKPFIETAPGRRGPWGPGHGSFLHFGNETLAVYHATDKPTDGWANRKARVQRVVWTMHGPNMGGYCGSLTNDFECAILQRDASPKRKANTLDWLPSVDWHGKARHAQHLDLYNEYLPCAGREGCILKINAKRVRMPVCW